MTEQTELLKFRILICFSALTRGIMISWPQVTQRSLKSMPERSTKNCFPPQGCAFFISRIQKGRRNFVKSSGALFAFREEQEESKW